MVCHIKGGTLADGVLFCFFFNRLLGKVFGPKSARSNGGMEKIGFLSRSVGSLVG